MGQAKQRGTFEERKAAAIVEHTAYLERCKAAQRAADDAEDRAEAARMSSMTQEEIDTEWTIRTRRRSKHSSAETALLIGAIMGMGGRL